MSSCSRMIWSICRLLDSQKLITIARDRDSEDCYVLVVLFLLVFFRPPIFRRPWADFRETATRRGRPMS